jgi:hypothetical protein
MPELNFAVRGGDHCYVDIADTNERALVKEFDQCLQNMESNRRDLGRVARQLKDQYVSKGKRVAGMGWQAFLEARRLNVDVVDKWVLRYEQHEGIKPKPITRPQVSSRHLSGTNYPETRHLDKPSPDPEQFVPAGYEDCGKNAKGDHIYKRSSWAEEPEAAPVVLEVSQDPEPEVNTEPCVEYVAIQIADLVGIRLSQLRTMEERTAAMRSAVATLRQMGMLPTLERVTPGGVTLECNATV